jgi:HD-like signal output (HDOD) protein/ActR/RegA family two-component response regulator
MDLSEPGRRRILFVDDEAKLLDGLRRMLYPMRKEWDMVFAASAKEALEALALDPFEVLVTDMRMPGMDGATLLDEVVKIYPEIVRLVLSGQSDQEMSIRSAKTAHQYLTKPCSAELLKTTLDRIFALRRLLAGRSLKRLVSGMTTLPSLPDVYQKLVQTLQSPEVSANDIGDVIASDIAMTAKVLQLANSAFFGASRAFSHPAEATRYLGIDTIKALVLTIGIFAQFRGPKAANALLEKLQSHSLHTARISQMIAKAEGIEKGIADDAFLGGIMHDVGKLVLISKDPEMYEGALTLARAEKLDLDPVEREAFGASHAEVGCYLLWLWGLPGAATEAVAFHHRPADCPAAGLSAVALVHIADALAHEFEPDSYWLPRLDESFLATAGLSGRLDSWRELAAEASRVGETA